MKKMIRFCNFIVISLIPLLTLRTSVASSSRFETVPNVQDLIGKFSRKLFENSILQQGSSSSSEMSLKRSLEIGDFDEFNELFRDAVIRLPDAQVSQKAVFATLRLDIRNLLCTNIQVGDIVLQYQMQSSTRFTLSVDIIDLDMDCNMDYSYKYGFVKGSGRARATSDDNDAKVVLVFESNDFGKWAPKSVSVDSCNADINVGSIDFSGGFVASILDVFEGLIKNVVKREVADVACDELSSLGTEFLGDVMDIASNFLATYLDGSTQSRNPLLTDQELQVPDGTNLLSFTDTNSTFGSLIDMALNEADALLGIEVDDPSGGRDLGINVFLRSNLLEQDGSYVFDMATLFPDGFFIFDGHDKLTETTMQLDSIKFWGLDSFTKFAPLNRIGDYTLQNELEWDFLTVELDVTLVIKPSTKEDSVIEQPSVKELVETIQIKFGVEQLDMVVSVLLAMDQDVLGALPLGPLLNMDNLLPCVMSSIYQMQLSQLQVSVDTIQVPTLSDFVSPGMDRVVSRAVEAVYEMYEAVFIKAMPNIFDVFIVDMVNQDFIVPYIQDNQDCPLISSGSGFVDFRDLLLEPDLARTRGATGDSPYGTLAATLMDLLTQQFLSLDTDGYPKLNSMVQDFTKDHSGVAGRFYYPGSFFDVNLGEDTSVNFTFADSFQLQASNAMVYNLNTLVAPITVLLPLTEPHTLSNNFNLGPMDGKPVTASMRLSLDILGEDSPLQMYNYMEVSVSIPQTVMYADVMATMTTRRLLEFPIQDITNFNCWLAALPTPELDKSGNWIGQGNEPSLMLKKLFVFLSEMTIGFKCLTCSSTGLDILPDTLQLLDQAGVMAKLTSGVELFATEFASSDWLQLTVDRFLADAPKFCPHNALYNASAVTSTEYDSLGLPGLSKPTVETLILTGASAVNIALCVVGESHARMILPKPSDPLESQNKALQVPTGVRLLDFMDLGESIGPWAEELWQEARKAINGNSTFVVSDFLNDQLLDENGIFTLSLDGIGFEGSGVEIDVKGIRVSGLDSISKLNLLDAIGPQTLQNTIDLDRIGFELILDIGVASSAPGRFATMPTEKEEMILSFGLNEVKVNLALLLALDLDKLGSLELGSLLHADNILPCVMSTLFAMDVSQLVVNVGSVETPSLTGFLSEPIEDVLIEFTQSLFDQYGSRLVEGMPNIFDVTVRGLVNGALKNYNFGQGTVCPSATSVSRASAFMDFRDLLLSPSESSALGGSGSSPYGTMASSLFGMLKDRFLSPDDSGKPALNSVLIAPLTESQSGTVGTLSSRDSLFNVSTVVDDAFWSTILQSFLLRASNAKISNIDILTEPLTVLEPVEDPHVLSNTFNFGPVRDRPLNASVRVVLSVEGEESPLKMYNEMDIQLSLPLSVLYADLLIKSSAERFLGFPLKDVLNINCWLATMPTPELDHTGNWVEPGLDPSLALEQFVLFLSTSNFGFDCIECSSTGLAILPEILGVLETSEIGATLLDGVELFVKDLSESHWLQLSIDRILGDAPMFCPHDPLYDENAVASNYSRLDFPTLSRSSVETLILAGASAAQAAVFVIGESHARMPQPEPNDPLAAQNALEIPAGVRLLDFTNLEESLGAWAETLWSEVRKAVSGPVSDEGGLDVVQMFRDMFLDQDGALGLTFDDLGFNEAGVQVYVKEIRISGLDSINQLDLLNPIGSQTLKNVIQMENLAVDLVVVISVESASGRRRMEENEMKLSFGITDINVDLALLLALDLDEVGGLELGSLLHIKNMLPCFLSSMLTVDVTQLHVTAGSVDTPIIEGFLSAPNQETLQTSIDSLFSAFGDNVLAGIPNFFDKTVRHVVNRLLGYYTESNADVVCPSLVSTISSSFVDFRDLLMPASTSRALGRSSKYGDLIPTLLDFIQETVVDIDPLDGTSGINDLLIRPLTKGQSNEEGTLSFPGNLFDQNSKLDVGGLQANIELKAYNARIEKLDTVGTPIELLQPVLGLPWMINNTATFGVGPYPFRFATTFLIGVADGAEVRIRNEVDISIDLSAATVVAGTLLKIAEDPFFSFPLRDIADINCWLATIPAPPLDEYGVRAIGSEPTASLADLAVSVSRMGLNVTCIDCSSPDMYELARVLSSPEAVDDATRVANRVLDYVTGLLGGNFLQTQIDRFLNDAAQKCPHNAAYNPNPPAAQYKDFEPTDREENSVGFLIAIVVAAAGLFGVVVLIVFTVKCIVRRRHRRWLRTLTTENIISLHREQVREHEVNQATKSMFTSPVIPWYVRYSMPIIILGNIAFFLSGHLSLGATVNIEATLAGERITIEKFFDFSMARSTLDIWNAGGKELAMLILIFSGVWPYTKQIITLILWFVPPNVVTATRRGTILFWLDALAKWSMVDIFALVIAIASFRVSIDSPDVAFLTDNFYSIQLMVVPLWGLYANMIAQLISQISSHFIIHYHRRIVSVAQKENNRHLRIQDSATIDANESSLSSSSLGTTSGNSTDRSDEVRGEERDLLCQHAFLRPHRGSSDKLQARRGVNAVIIMVSIAVVFLVIFGCTRPSFSVEVLGIIGVAVESGQEFQKAVTDYSVFSVVALLMEEARFLDTAGDYIGLGALSILVILTVFVVPLFQTVILLRQWFTPLGRSRRKKHSLLVEICQAWQYIEVYLIAVIVSAWQLGPVSDFMINDYCGDLDPFFATLVYYGIIKPQDAQCFMVQASIESATYMLISAAIILALMNTFIMKAVHQYNRDTDPTLLWFEAHSIQNDKLGSTTDEEDLFQIMEEIHPVPVMFTDTFRWVLRREDAVLSRSMRLGLDDEAKLGVQEAFPDVASEAGSRSEIDDVPTMLSYPTNDDKDDDQSGYSGVENIASNEDPPILVPALACDSFEEESTIRQDTEAVEASEPGSQPKQSKRRIMSIPSFRSLFSGNTVASAATSTPWTCAHCSYQNADRSNSTCALCGRNRNADVASVASSSASSYLTSSHEVDTDVDASMLGPIQEDASTQVA